jgi:hypothetical protein
LEGKDLEMPKNKEAKKHGDFGSEDGSISETLMLLPKEIQKKSRSNRIKYEQDRRNLEQWAANGMMSGGEDQNVEEFEGYDE